jgi:hypothetical protein
MKTLIIGLIGVGAVIFAVAIGLGDTTPAVIGFLLFAIGVILPRLLGGRSL